MNAALSLLWLAAATPAEDWAAKACPEVQSDDASMMEMKQRVWSRVDCLKSKMNEQLDRTLLPLKKKKAPQFHTWMDLQASFNRWSEDVCAQADELEWLSFEDRQWMAGSLRGMTQAACLQTLFGERGYVAQLTADQDWAALRQHVKDESVEGAKRKVELGTLHQSLSTLAGTALPAKATTAARADRLVTKPEAVELVERMERVRTEPALLAASQCALLPSYGEGCAADLGAYLLGLIPAHSQTP